MAAITAALIAYETLRYAAARASFMRCMATGGSRPHGMTVVHETIARRIVFGAGAIATLPAELAALGLRAAARDRGAIAGDPGRAPARGSRRGGDRSSACASTCRPDLPTTPAPRPPELGADCLVSIGGGSAVGLAKAVALTEGLPIAAVPTTYAGSELTTVWGITEDGRKTTGRHRASRRASSSTTPS